MAEQSREDHQGNLSGQDGREQRACPQLVTDQEEVVEHESMAQNEVEAGAATIQGQKSEPVMHREADNQDRPQDGRTSCHPSLMPRRCLSGKDIFDPEDGQTMSQCFSMSGLWNNVDLGLVKSRIAMWNRDR